MHKYEIILYWSKTDNAYIAAVPELPGCMADGKSYVEAVKNVEVVISEWIETAKSLGRSIPEAKGRLLYARMPCHDKSGADFLAGSLYVLKKNQDLYRRLA